MSLQDSFKKNFKLQDKCPAAPTSGATKNSKATPPHRVVVPSDSLTPQIKPSTPAVKFSNDTERLQHINNIRKAPVGAQIKRVIDLLLETRQGLTAEQINEACYVDIKANKGVFDSLKDNLKVKYDGECFSYKAKHDLKDEDEYPTVLEDLQALKGSRKIWLVSNFDSQEDVTYPTNPKIAIGVKNWVRQLYHDVDLPRDFIDIEKYLLKNGMKPFTNSGKTGRSPSSRYSVQAQAQEKEERYQQEDKAHQSSPA